MSVIGKNIRYLRKKRGMSQDDLGALVGKSASTIQMWESGFRSPTMGSVQRLGEVFAVDISELVTSDMQSKGIYSMLDIGFRPVPLYDNLCCGNGGFVDDNILEMIAVPDNGLNPGLDYFCQYARGDSMAGAGISDGDLLVFQRCDQVSSGVIGCFCVEDNVATCKKYSEVNGVILLQPMNSDYDPIVVDPLESNVRCLGMLKKVIKDFEWED